MWNCIKTDNGKKENKTVYRQQSKFDQYQMLLSYFIFNIEKLFCLFVFVYGMRANKENRLA